MEQGVSAHSGGGAAVSVSSEARSAERYTLLMRAAKLIADGREYLCVMRDASATGTKVRVFHPITKARRLELELGNGERIGVQPVWHCNEYVGLRFDSEVDVHNIIEERPNPYAKRPIRLNVDKPVLLQSGALNQAVTLRNISQGGACVSSPQRLTLHQSVQINVQGLEPIFAKICWRTMPLHGLVFERNYTIEELALALQTLHNTPAADPLPAAPTKQLGT